MAQKLIRGRALQAGSPYLTNSFESVYNILLKQTFSKAFPENMIVCRECFLSLDFEKEDYF
ncbi:MAG: hypothetical protein J7J52_06845 [Deltaproteobacteria bacterium]|nr:hypothetical protein [Deltaproteobacteria bacterium]